MTVSSLLKCVTNHIGISEYNFNSTTAVGGSSCSGQGDGLQDQRSCWNPKF